jgi:hypothetical protein
MTSVIVVGLIRIEIPDGSNRFCGEKVFEEEKLSEVSHITAISILQRSTLWGLVWNTAIVYSQNRPCDNGWTETVFMAVFDIGVFFLCYGLGIAFAVSPQFTQGFNHFGTKII